MKKLSARPVSRPLTLENKRNRETASLQTSMLFREIQRFFGPTKHIFIGTQQLPRYFE